MVCITYFILILLSSSVYSRTCFSLTLSSLPIYPPPEAAGAAAAPVCSGSFQPLVEPLWGGGLISADIYGHRPICCTLHSFHALPEVLCNYPDIDEGWFQQVIAGSSAVFTHLSKMSLSITSGKLISTQWPYSLIISESVCVCVCKKNDK